MGNVNNAQTFTDRAVRALQGANRFIRAVEGLLIDTVSGFMPWLTPIVPAIMTYHGMMEYLGFGQPAAIVSAIVVETLGLAGVNTTFQFWDYNDSKNKSEQRAPVLVSLLTSIFYLAVVLIVNVLVDQDPVIEKKVAKGLLSSLSVCGGIIVALRSQHSRRLEGNEEEHEARSERSRNRRQNTQEAQNNATYAQLAPDWRNLSDAEKMALVGLEPEEILSRYPGLALRTAQLWAQRLRSNGFHPENSLPASESMEE